MVAAQGQNSLVAAPAPGGRDPRADGARAPQATPAAASPRGDEVALSAAASSAATDAAAAKSATGEPLSRDELRQLKELKKRDAEVRTHEQAHVAAAGALYRGGPTYETQRGPDGKDYAVGGSVAIDSDPVPGDPEATIVKMQQVRRAALAPADPSSTDRRVAAQASQAEAKARQEIAEGQSDPDAAEPATGTAPSEDAAEAPGSPPEFPAGYTKAAKAAALDLPRLIDIVA